MRELTIDRRKWARGDMGGGSALLNEIGSMCCLGFDMRGCGFKPKEIRNQAMPDDVGDMDKQMKRTAKKVPHLVNTLDNPWADSTDEDGLLRLRATKFAIKAAAINDNVKIAERTREKRLKALFFEQEIALQFVN